MNLATFLNSKKYDNEIKEILIAIQIGSIDLYNKLNQQESDLFGSLGQKNIQNEDVQKLDLIANDIFINNFKKTDCIHSVLSEEEKEVRILNNSGSHLIAMDPLDGSSNIDVNIPVGSIFSVLMNNEEGFLQKGSSQRLACYVIYGTAAMLVFAIDNEAYGFSLNIKTSQYILTHPNIQTPKTGSIFSINEGNLNSLTKSVVNYVKFCKELNSNGKRTHTGRFIGSLVADFHRNMLKGGIFIYSKTNDKPEGQLRLIYECNPIAFIAKATNSLSSNLKEEILDVKPEHIHQRTPFVVGSSEMVQKILSLQISERT
ncbi:MAG: fructose-bisphosphatase class I [Flavobacteriales bacterium]|nr:fructose-bisphosphatase class I [Flavobacteriales bacterium]|tara:strand:+ start:7530 stop:8474 length:945 start_codon:yes stop_codon:yes gene_type:complete